MAYEIRQSIEAAKISWKDKQDHHDDDELDDDHDVEVEYVRD